MIAPRPSDDRSYRFVVAALLIASIGFRVALYLRRDGLWEDEAMLALSVAARSFLELLRPLDYSQTAPAGFLWVQRALVGVLGVNELSFRVLPLVAGCATCWLTFDVARRLTGRAPAAIALAVIGSSAFMARYAVEAKPYAVDAAVGLLIVGATLSVAASPASRSRWLALAGLGAVAMVGTVATVFQAAAAWMALAWICRGRKLGGRLAGIAGLWAALFAVHYVVVLRPVAEGSYLAYYWAPAMLTPGDGAFVHRLGTAVDQTLMGMTVWAVLAGFGPLILAFVALGVHAVWRARGPADTWLLIGPVVLVFAASIAGRYPIATRLVLFAAPLLAIFLAEGVVVAWRAIPAAVPMPLRLAGAALVAALGIPGSIVSLPLVRRGPDMRLATATIARERRPGEPVYVSARALPAWVLYTTDWSHPNRARLEWVSRAAAPSGPAFANAGSRGGRAPLTPDSLVYVQPAGPELIGTASGFQTRGVMGLVRSRPDSGWADAEAHRLKALATPTGWVVVTWYGWVADEPKILIAGMRAAGGELERSVVSSTAAAYRFAFPIRRIPARHAGNGVAGSRESVP